MALLQQQQANEIRSVDRIAALNRQRRAGSGGSARAVDAGGGGSPVALGGGGPPPPGGDDALVGEFEMTEAEVAETERRQESYVVGVAASLWGGGGGGGGGGTYLWGCCTAAVACSSNPSAPTPHVSNASAPTPHDAFVHPHRLSTVTVAYITLFRMALELVLLDSKVGVVLGVWQWRTRRLCTPDFTSSTHCRAQVPSFSFAAISAHFHTGTRRWWVLWPGRCRTDGQRCFCTAVDTVKAEMEMAVLALDEDTGEHMKNTQAFLR